MKKEILGVKIDDITLNEAVSQMEKWICNGGKHYIVTPNPEFLVEAYKDRDFKDILNKADLAIPDGVGLKLAGVKNRTSGVDLMEKLIVKSSEKGLTVSFLGGKDGVAERLAERLKRIYQNTSVAFAESGGKVSKDGETEDGKKLNIPPSDILFVAFGPPKQEKWIVKNLPKIPVKVAIGVGGAFDYLSGKVPRAPGWIRDLGFEWLFRLLVQPWRIKRQFTIIEYLWLLTLKRLKG